MIKPGTRRAYLRLSKSTVRMCNCLQTEEAPEINELRQAACDVINRLENADIPDKYRFLFLDRQLELKQALLKAGCVDE